MEYNETRDGPALLIDYTDDQGVRGFRTIVPDTIRLCREGWVLLAYDYEANACMDIIMSRIHGIWEPKSFSGLYGIK